MGSVTSVTSFSYLVVFSYHFFEIQPFSELDISCVIAVHLARLLSKLKCKAAATFLVLVFAF